MKRGRRGILVLSVAATLAAAVPAGFASTPVPAEAPATPAHQSPTSPQALAEQVVAAFAEGDRETFDALYPFADGRELVASAVQGEYPLRAGLARPVRTTPDRAVLLLSGHVEFGNSGNETSTARAFSGLYEARRGEGGWRLTERISFGDVARIERHRLDVRLEPGDRLVVEDTLTVAALGGDGFAAMLNHTAHGLHARVDGRDVEASFGGGLLWVPVPAGTHSVQLRYEIDVAADAEESRNSGWFGPHFGHVRHQYFWHPFYDFQSAAQQAQFAVTVRAPRSHRVATDLPQSESVEAGERVVRAASREPTFALSLFYDDGWEPVEREASGYRLMIFGEDDFSPEPDDLAAAFRRVYEALDARFGAPTAGYMAVVQGRAREGGGWLFRSNDAAVTPARGGGSISRGGPWPRAWFGHEVAHGWTRPTGAAANFLREGWATFAESILLEEEYGAETASQFWEVQRSLYFLGGHEGARTLLNDPSNSGVGYHKGAWVLRMLRDEVGTEAFRRGMAAYMAIPPGAPAGIDEFAEAIAGASGRSMESFLQPWLQEASIPDVHVSLRDDHLLLRQEGVVFDLPLEVELLTHEGVVRRNVRLQEREQELALGDLAPVRSVRLDPDHRLLIRRHRGDTIELRTSAPDAAAVSLGGSFARAPITARRDGDDWIVELRLTEGRYVYWWQVDDERGELRSLTVGSREEVDHEAYPR